ncbi:Asx homology domain-containing protein [Cladorrhinum sp. PSN332]|nr:Asx homology domain-containing protein [Cladorrhinum sp. PSN332]
MSRKIVEESYSDSSSSSSGRAGDERRLPQPTPLAGKAPDPPPLPSSGSWGQGYYGLSTSPPFAAKPWGHPPQPPSGTNDNASSMQPNSGDKGKCALSSVSSLTVPTPPPSGNAGNASNNMQSDFWGKGNNGFSTSPPLPQTARGRPPPSVNNGNASSIQSSTGNDPVFSGAVKSDRSVSFRSSPPDFTGKQFMASSGPIPSCSSSSEFIPPSNSELSESVFKKSDDSVVPDNYIPSDYLPMTNPPASPPRKGKAAAKGGKPATKGGKPAAKASKPTAKSGVLKRKVKWSGPALWTSYKSPLKKPEFLRAMILNPRAWAVLEPDARKSILAKLPNNKHILDLGTSEARPNLKELSNDDNFRHDCARYVEHLKEGMHDPEWLRQAWIAQKKHIRGDFDPFLNTLFTVTWDAPLPGVDTYRPEDGSKESSETRSKESA